MQCSNNYQQSAVTLGTFAFPTLTGATTTNLTVELTTAATGSSGNFWVGGSGTQTINASQSTAASNAAISEVTTAVSSNLDLTKPLFCDLNLAAATANITNVTTNVLTIKPAPGT
jgi:hypothetical protein